MTPYFAQPRKERRAAGRAVEAREVGSRVLKYEHIICFVKTTTAYCCVPTCRWLLLLLLQMRESPLGVCPAEALWVCTCVRTWGGNSKSTKE